MATEGSELDHSPKSSGVSENTPALGGQLDLLRVLLVCLAVVVLGRSFVYEPFKIPSSSMVPTLLAGDRIFVAKYSYGLTIPFTKTSLVKWSGPERGDVIVFLFPREESLYYVKRVIGVPGDRIEVKGKDILINDQVVEKVRVEDPSELIKLSGGSNGIVGEVYKEKIGDKSHYVVYRDGGVSDFLRRGEASVIDEGKYFVMGDNRDESYDSRRWGFVPRENIRGKAQLIWASIEPGVGLLGLGKMRWSRVFSYIR